jgi:cytochrome bd-type quinol oxidase subunit 1
MIPALIGIVLAACLFAALLWSIYRAVTLTGTPRVVHAFLAISTIIVVCAVTWDFHAMMLSGGITCAVTAFIALWQERRWSKLLPLVQLLLGLGATYAGYALLAGPSLPAPPAL